MADDLGITSMLGVNKETVMNAGGTIVDTILWLIVAGAIGVVVWYIVYYLSFNHKFRIKDKTNNVLRIIDDRAKIVKDKNDGIEKWRLFKKNVFAPVPPDEALSLTNKGKYSVEAEWSEEGGFEYIIPKNNKKIENTGKLTTNNKIFLKNEYKKAQLDKKKSLGDVVVAVAPIAAITIMVVALFVFWGEITKPSLDMASKMADYSKNENDFRIKQMELLNQINGKLQNLNPSDNQPEERPN